MYVCVSVCVGLEYGQRERETDSQDRERYRQRQGKREMSVCVCVAVFVRAGVWVHVCVRKLLLTSLPHLHILFYGKCKWLYDYLYMRPA